MYLGADFAQVGLTHRLFLRRLDSERTPLQQASIACTAGRESPWRMANRECEHRGGRPRKDSHQRDGRRVRAAGRRGRFAHCPEATWCLAKAVSLHIIQPGAGTDLSMLVRAEVDKGIDPFETVRDRTRRTASRLTWKARPERLQLTPTAVKTPVSNLFRWVGGFDLHRIDIDGVPKGADLGKLRQSTGPGHVVAAITGRAGTGRLRRFRQPGERLSERYPAPVEGAFPRRGRRAYARPRGSRWPRARHCFPGPPSAGP